MEEGNKIAEKFARPSFTMAGSFNQSHNKNMNNHDATFIDNDYLQLIFPIDKTFLLGSPVGMFAAVYFEENFVRSKLPTVGDFYNLFHPSDLVANRVEPLVKRYEYPESRQVDPRKFPD